MKRNIDKILLDWKNDPRRRPLLIRGARQVGKSYSVRNFGKNHFKNIIEIDFELNPEFADCFTTLNPVEINEKISILTRQDIHEDETLLFFDEIQKCPPAIMALRYYYEKIPKLHVIGAGSLLEFVMNSEELKIPVGRIQYLYMKPMSFIEFCEAAGETRLKEYIDQMALNSVETAIHTHALDVLKKYMITGGMPAAVDEYFTTGDIMKCQRIQSSIIQTFRDDFGKYASLVKHKHLQVIFNAVPKMVGNKFKYSNIDNSIPSRELKNALELLEQAGIVHRVFAVSGSGVPLGTGIKERHFKTIFLDVGLMQNICGYQGDIINSSDILSIHKGSVAEQFAGQELLAYQDPYRQSALYYWIREVKSSSAEVDYLVEHGSRVFPVETKSGPAGKLRSIRLFMEQNQIKTGIVISQQKFSRLDELVFIPLYAIKNLHQVLSGENEK